MVSKRGKEFKQNTDPDYLKAYNQAFRAGYKSAHKEYEKELLYFIDKKNKRR